MEYGKILATLGAPSLMLGTAAMAQDKPEIAFVVNGPSDFWKLAEAGVKKAQGELPDVTLSFRYPERADAAIQQRVVDDLIAAGADAVAVSVVDPATATDAINGAAAQVPYFTFDSVSLSRSPFRGQAVPPPRRSRPWHSSSTPLPTSGSSPKPA